MSTGGIAGKRLILVVEDDESSKAYVAAALRHDFDVLVAASAAEARTHLAAHLHGIAAVLMDLSLKGDEDGLVLTRWLRADSRWQHVPIIATTAHALPRDRHGALAAGCTAFLAKPISREELTAAIRDALSTVSGAAPAPG